MVKNCTPHPISVADESGVIVRTIEPSGVLPRRSAICEDLYETVSVDGFEVPLFKDRKGPVFGLPDPVDGVTLIVSGMVLDACKGRKDVIAPDTSPNGNCLRNEKGQIIAVRRFLAA